MMKKILFSAIVLSLLCSINSNAQSDPKEKGLQAITVDAIKGQLEFLSSDWMEGRATGERGAYLAADYVASMFRVFGAAPAGDAEVSRGRMPRMFPGGQPLSPQKTYFQNFTLIETAAFLGFNPNN